MEYPVEIGEVVRAVLALSEAQGKFVYEDELASLVLERLGATGGISGHQIYPEGDHGTGRAGFIRLMERMKGSPRGTWATCQIEGADYWTGIMSRGEGRSVEQRYTRDVPATFEVLARMVVGYDCYLARQDVERERVERRNNDVLKRLGLMRGQELKAVSIDGKIRRGVLIEDRSDPSAIVLSFRVANKMFRGTMQARSLEQGIQEANEKQKKEFDTSSGFEF